jgi:hypothetical protein
MKEKKNPLGKGLVLAVKADMVFQGGGGEYQSIQGGNARSS